MFYLLRGTSIVDHFQSRGCPLDEVATVFLRDRERTTGRKKIFQHPELFLKGLMLNDHIYGRNVYMNQIKKGTHAYAYAKES